MCILDSLQEDIAIKERKIDILNRAIIIIMHNDKASNELVRNIDKAIDDIHKALNKEMMRNTNKN